MQIKESRLEEKQNPRSQMRHRRFGRTGLQMPILSCGGMRYQQSWSDLPASAIEAAGQANLEATVRRALGVGICHIETARGYGSSEMQLGRILPSLPREQIILQTKVAPCADPHEFEATVKKSLALLQVSHVDLLALHGINNDETLDWSLRPGGCLEMAERLREQGLCRWIGFSTHGATSTIVSAIESGRFDYVNLHWYFVNQSNSPAIEAATRHDMGVFIISPNDKGGKLYEPPPKLVELCAPLHPMEFNDLFCWAHPAIHTLSLGASRPSDFDIHLNALRYYDQAGEITAPIALRIQEEMAHVLGSDWMAGWQVGIPPWEECPDQINVWEIVRLWNFAQGLDLVEFGKMRYNLLGNGGHWFPGQQAHTFDQPQTRAAMKHTLRDHPFCDKILDVLASAHTLLSDKPRQRLSST